MSFFHLPRRLSRRGEKKSSEKSPERSPRSRSTRSLDQPSVSHVPMPIDSIANIVLDPTNYGELQRASSTRESPKAEPSHSNCDDAASLKPDSLPPSPLSSADTTSTKHRPSQSLSDIVFNPTMLSALYHTRDSQSSPSHHDSSSVPSSIPGDNSSSTEERESV